MTPISTLRNPRGAGPILERADSLEPIRVQEGKGFKFLLLRAKDGTGTATDPERSASSALRLLYREAEEELVTRLGFVIKVPTGLIDTLVKLLERHSNKVQEGYLSHVRR